MSFSQQALLANAGQRRKMVEDHLVARGITDPRVLSAMRKVPRHLFVADSLGHRAYGDHPLPIGENQTISQPYIVAAMSAALELKGHERVLEIGTGCGFQSAILGELASQVFTIERLSVLSKKAKKLLDDLGYSNINFKVFDGSYGWRDQSPFDGILVTAGAPEIPSALIDQLTEGGKIVTPVGNLETQKLVVATLKGGKLSQKVIGDCKFVPLVGKFGLTGRPDPL